MSEQEFVNEDLCAKCGGRCCKIGGCMYFVTDFESMKINYIESILDTGRVSIKADLCFDRLPNGKVVVTPILYLVARSINRDVVDLVSFRNGCVSLEENGCHFSFEDRPSGGKYHIPMENLECYGAFNTIEEVRKFLPYQKVLQRIVKRRTGMNVNEKIKQDIELLLIKILKKDFDDVPEAEIGAFKGTFGVILEAYPEEFKKALLESKKPISILQRTK